MNKIIAKVTKLALGGDIAACRLLLERAVPAIKPIDAGVAVAMPANATLTEKAGAMVDAMASGIISPTSAAAMISALANMVRVTETDDLVRRLEALEVDQHKESAP